jgi:3-oxoacyl-[acyl-carrier protein] reductase
VADFNFLVTGAGRDIGQAIAVKLARPGSFAILHYHESIEGAQQTLDAVREAGGDGTIIKADLGTLEGISTLANSAIDALNGSMLHAIILNAAATAPAPIGGDDDLALQQMVSVNILGAWRLVNLLSPVIAQNGSVTAITIAAARQVFHPDFGFFTATKAAVESFVKAWAVGFGPRGIRANAVAPGVVEVNFRSELLADPDFRAQLEQVTALGRAGQPHDISDIVAFLVSDNARWITGQVIDASGGWRL